ncbi:hypothetical protein TeGR_g6383 [Tetraparma gracilis]|uniref:Cysteine protease n=1 Tax=Tetraparma gracilis TaxID=2962635 RepID=A0ABQ6N1U1_9STRA|nr:hypothetical protein TeGR_g6383 [Tetraparma gracilis]
MNSSIANLFASVSSLLPSATPEPEVASSASSSGRSAQELYESSEAGVGDLLVAEESAEQQSSPYNCHILGVKYDEISYPLRRQHEYSLYWFSYRTSFPPLPPYPITSDAGWGCMLRASQMLLAETLRRHFRSPSWRSSDAPADDPLDDSLLRWFADAPDPKACPFGIHSLCRSGLHEDKYPGEWVGPTAACRILDRCLASPTTSVDAGGAGGRPIKTFVADGGCVYTSEVNSFMRPSSPSSPSTPPPPAASASDPFDPLFAPPPEPDKPAQGWDHALLLLVPLCVGSYKVMRSAPAEKRESIRRFFEMRQGVGILGGTPRHAIWFYGASDPPPAPAQGERPPGHGTTLYGLDPHTVQFAPSLDSEGRVALTSEYRKSVHTSGVSTPLNDIDPTLALGFYLRDSSDFSALCAELRAGACGGGRGTLFGVEEVRPDYESNVGAMDDLLGGGGDEDECGGGESDEDDFVFI